MKAIISNDYVFLFLRIVLGFAFIIASVEKMADPAAFATSIGHYKLLSPAVAMVVATYLPWIELLAGFGLVLGLFARGSSLLIFIMLVVFTGGVISAVLRGLDISCGCFTQDPTVGKVGWLKVGENSAMILGSVILLYSRNTRFTLEQFFQRGATTNERPAPTQLE